MKESVEKRARKKNSEEIAFRMLRGGVKKDEVGHWTELSLAEVEELMKQL